MRLNTFNFILVTKGFLILNVIDSIYGRMIGEGFFPNYYDNPQVQQRELIKTALQKLINEPQWESNWPNPSTKLGQVSAVALDNDGRLLVFHRGSNVWDETTFNMRNVFNFIGTPAIKEPAILVLNDTGELVDQWGQDLFFMPHGITVDKEDNVWVTDVAMHQVLKFSPKNRLKPAMVLGAKFIPGEDDTHFCKPSAVAVLANGDFFVADGYCNHRIIKFSKTGNIILQWGTNHGSSNYRFNVPHALTLAEDRGLVCVADREHGRAACFHHDNGTYVTSFRHWLIGQRLFSLAYTPVHGGRLFVVNGPGGGAPVRGYVIDFESGRLIQTFATEDGLQNPHNIAVSADGVNAYVTELNPYKVYKFTDESLRNENLTAEKKHVKPTATVELVSGSPAGAGGDEWAWWGGAGGAAGAALLALGALALLRARNSGRKGATRRRWEYGHGEFKLRRLLERRRFTRVHSDDSDEEPAPMLPHSSPATA